MARQSLVVPESETIAFVAQDPSPTRHDEAFAAEESTFVPHGRQPIATFAQTPDAQTNDTHRSAEGKATRVPNEEAVDQLLSDESVW